MVGESVEEVEAPALHRHPNQARAATMSSCVQKGFWYEDETMQQGGARANARELAPLNDWKLAKHVRR